MDNTVSLVIPAAGKGSRMNRDIPKPYIEIDGKTILEYTVSRFLGLKTLRQIIVATSPEYIDRTQQELSRIIPDNVELTCLAGGNERQHSIDNALKKTGAVDLVAVHDAVRPFVKPEHIAACCRAAGTHGGAVLGIPVRDTIKRVDDALFIRETPDRRTMWLAQTPQVFRKKNLVEAYRRAEQDSFTGTDDASLVERTGIKVKIVEGEPSNFKITYPADLKLAERLLREQENE